MTIYHCYGEVPFGRYCRNSGKYYETATFTQIIGLLPWNVEHWQGDDYIGRYPARYTVSQTALIVDLWLDDAIPAESVALESIRAGDFYLSHGAGDAVRTPAGSREALAKQQELLEHKTLTTRDIGPMDTIRLTHMALVRRPAMRQDYPVRIVMSVDDAEVPVADLAAGTDHD